MKAKQFLDIVCIKGEKIDLCCLRADEEAIKMYTKWMNDESINIWLRHNSSVDQYLSEKEWAEKKPEPGKNRFAIVEKETRNLIGTCGCDCVDGITANLGICIGEESGRNKGYGTEVIKLLIRFAFMQLNAHRVQLRLVSSNERALKCYEKAGLKKCGVQHEAVYYNGGYDDLLNMEILREDWEVEIQLPF